MQYWAGIDVGSLTTEVVIIDAERHVVGSSIVPTGARSMRAVEEAMNGALTRAAISDENVASIVSTGYGRQNVQGRDKDVTEITCHARGAHFLFPDSRFVLDVGGQDSKAIALDGSGRVADFAMNDKCAAGTGRFLEVMARALEIELDDMGHLAVQATKKLTISSMCTVFAESEVVSLLSRGEAVPDIVAGLSRAISERIRSLAQRVGIRDDVTMTGGVAKNGAVVRALEQVCGKSFNIPPEPQVVGALGAALIAQGIGR
ncbi:MAG: 2-hydroxyglutaryl-CoA dehydratase [Candidatus Hydrogenedentes bacterium]|nr:2-hydroxyglutaryl-CoA dehydratase [Candidatus Hydrogenedentota bacterium]